jgi:hypothetical protein
VSLRHNQDQQQGLARAIAGGSTVAAWAKTHDIPKRTAYTWARSAAVRATVERIRRRSLDRAIGRLSRDATAAASTIAKLAQSAESETVKLTAARGLLADLMTVSDYATLERRLAEVEERLEATHHTPD